MNEFEVHGWADDGWGAVADAFAGCFTLRNELGGAVSVYAHGKAVVDIWGGVADARTGRLWLEETVTPVFSTTKGATALCAHMLVERGMLDLDAPIASYWPEFAAAGKSEVPVRWALTHQAGLPHVDQDLTFEDLRAEGPVLQALATQEPIWEPGTYFGYHAVTYGHLVGELVRRTSGLPLGEFFAREVAAPLGLSAWIGLPVDQAVRLAHLERVEQPVPEAAAMFTDARATLERAISLGKALPVSLVDGSAHDFNDRGVLAIPLGGSSMVSDARSVARMYAAAVGEVDGIRLLQGSTARAAAELQTSGVPYYGWPTAYAHVSPFAFALGFSPLPDLGESAFGHGGAGGSLGGADLDSETGFGYVMNRMDATNPDDRATSLISAVRKCLGS